MNNPAFVMPRPHGGRFPGVTRVDKAEKKIRPLSNPRNPLKNLDSDEELQEYPSQSFP